MENRRPNNKSIQSFQDLIVYKNAYKLMVVIHTKLIPKLPKEERYDLIDQIRRSSKAGPALIAEGFAKRYQVRQWRKYLNDAMGECYETINHISVCRDVYGHLISPDSCNKLVEEYTIICKQLTKLGQAWQNYQNNK